MWCVNKQGERITDVGIMMTSMMIPMMAMMIWVDNDEEISSLESLKWPWLCGESGEVLFFAYL